MNSTRNTVETDVLIVGAGPSGAATSALLATYGIENIMINKYGGTAPTPRAHITNQRTMEVLRDLGLERRALEFATPQRQMAEHVYANTLVSEELGRLLTWYNHPKWKAEHDLASPCSVCDIPQTEMEPLLVHEAANRGSKVLLNTEYLSQEQDEAGVTVTLRDHIKGQDFSVRCKYLVAADGGKSQIVKDIGLLLVGRGGLGGSIGVYFKGDLSRYVEHRQGDMYWLVQPGVGMGGHSIGVLRMVKPWDYWVATSGFDIKTGPPDLTDDLARDIAYRLIGEKEVEIEVLEISTWTVNDICATENIRGRVVAMGDAVHRHPPMNGLGSNTCIQDAYNLAWKLAMILRGQAGHGLLQSYEDERVPVGEYIVKRANKSMAVVPNLLQSLGLDGAADAAGLEDCLASLKAPTQEAATKRARVRDAIDTSVVAFNTLGAELNQRYDSNAVVADGTPDPGYAEDPDFHYEASTRPGCHLPHVWLLQGRKKVSTFDLCGKGNFTLLTGLSGQAWVQAAEEVSNQLGIPIPVHVIGPGNTYDDIYGDFARMREVEEDGALLVRPDLFIGWRADTSNQAGELRDVMDRILARPVV